jgi:uncharacterized protein
MARVQSVIDVVERFAKELQAQGITLRKVYLFGSYARGEQTKWSDIDVALVADEFIGVSFEDIKQFIDVTIKKPYIMFEFHTFNTKDFEAGDPFVAEIKCTGIPILLSEDMPVI